MAGSRTRINANGAVTPQQLGFFASHGFLDLGPLLGADETRRWQQAFEAALRDPDAAPLWRESSGGSTYGVTNAVNADILLTAPEWDQLFRHPKILPVVEALMGREVCLNEVSLRQLSADGSTFFRDWHRDDYNTWTDFGESEHPLRLGYLQLMVYLSDVDETTHCISFSPEAVGDPALCPAEDTDEDARAQLAARGVYDLHGPAGTVCLFNSEILRTATTRPTRAERRSVQAYYGHLDAPSNNEQSAYPASLWRDSADAETRRFYSKVTDRTRQLASKL